MRLRYMAAALFLYFAFAATVDAAPQGQVAKADAGQSAIHPSTSAKPSNIKALPKDISEEAIHKLMHQYTGDLGVPCGYCHAENPQTGKIDFASDENPIKETARFMIKMTDDINTKYLAQLGDRRYSPPFTCGSCHQGQTEPPAFEAKSHP